MKQIWLMIMVAMGLSACSFIPGTEEPVVSPIFDGRYEDPLPGNFRVPKNGLRELREATHLEEGVNYLLASGSGQFSEPSFLELVKTLSKPHIIIVDLRQESHGLINGKAVSWTDGKHNWANVNRTLQDIQKDEEFRLNQALEKGVITLNSQTTPRQLVVEKAQTEKQFIESLGLRYERIPVQDHCRPTDEVVDHFVRFIVNLPPDTWLHFHCRAGKGRTTTFLTLYDMMLNANYVDLETILFRHKLIGGSDLAKAPEPDSYKHELALERLEFIRKFYIYCQQVPDFHISWSDWIATQAS